MGNRKINQAFGWTVEPASTDSSKVELNLRQSARMGDDDDTQFLAIIKVGEANYVPSNVEPRARIGPKMFTACVTRPIVRQLEQDPGVRSISASRRLANG